jgi:hypothetical protein
MYPIYFFIYLIPHHIVLDENDSIYEHVCNIFFFLYLFKFVSI